MCIQSLQHLKLTYDEADTKMVIHMIDANDTFMEIGVQGKNIIKSPDTDVLILLLYYFPYVISYIQVMVSDGNVNLKHFESYLCTPHTSYILHPY